MMSVVHLQSWPDAYKQACREAFLFVERFVCTSTIHAEKYNMASSKIGEFFPQSNILNNNNNDDEQISRIGCPILFASGQFSGCTVRMELDEVQKADLGRKCAAFIECSADKSNSHTGVILDMQG